MEQCFDPRCRDGAAPDRQVQEAIAGVFRKFRELGSARQVLLWYREEKLLLPALSRESGNRKVVWIEPIYPRSQTTATEYRDLTLNLLIESTTQRRDRRIWN